MILWHYKAALFLWELICYPPWVWEGGPWDTFVPEVWGGPA